jgi:acetyl esterase/lipase
MTMTTAAARHETSSYAIDVEDIEYLRIGSTPLLARRFQPRGRGPFPLMIDLHGGAWCNGDRHNDTMINEALAKSGVVVAALDFRMPPAAAYPASVADINYAVRWFKSEARRFDIRADKVGAIGISSGGHQAMLAAMRPGDPRYAAHELAQGGSIDASLACVVMCWPVIDPLGRYTYAQKLKAAGGTYPEAINRVIPLHVQYWGNEEAMAEGNPVRALERGESVKMPPVLYLQGASDMVHPRADLDRFVAQYKKHGGDVDLVLYDGEVEGFLRKSGTHAAEDGMRRIIDFVHRHLG